MALYMFRSPSGDVVANHHDLAMPTPVHAVRKGSLAAVEAMRREGWERRLVAVAAEMIGEPGQVPYDGDPVTSGARSLHALAEECGFEVVIVSGADWCRVDGHHPSRVGFRAWWTRGKADDAAWCEPWRFELVEDTRTVAVDVKAKVGKVNHRSPGVGVQHVSQVASPWGVLLGVTALRKRLEGYRA